MKSLLQDIILLFFSLFFITILGGGVLDAQNTHFETIVNYSGEESLFSNVRIEPKAEELDALVASMGFAEDFRIAGIDLLPLSFYFDPRDGIEAAYDAYLDELNTESETYLAFFVSYGENGERAGDLEFSMPINGSFADFTPTERAVIESRLRVTFLENLPGSVNLAISKTIQRCIDLFSRSESIVFDLSELNFEELQHGTNDMPELTPVSVNSPSNLEDKGIYDYSGLSLVNDQLGNLIDEALPDLQNYETAVYLTSDLNENSASMIEVAAGSFGNEQEKFSLWLYFKWDSPTTYTIWAKGHSNVSQDEALLFLADFFENPNGEILAAREESGEADTSQKTVDVECIGKYRTFGELAAQFKPTGNFTHGKDWTAYCMFEDDFPDEITLNPFRTIEQLRAGFIAGIVDGLAGTVNGIFTLAKGYKEVMRHVPLTNEWVFDLVIKTIREKSLYKAWNIKLEDQVTFYATVKTVLTKVIEGLDCVWDGIYQKVVVFLSRLNPLSGWYSTAYIQGLIAFEVIVEILTAGTGAAANLATKLANLGADISKIGTKIASLGPDAVKLIRRPDNWGSHVDDLGAELGNAANLTGRRAGCMSAIGHCFIGTTLVAMAGGPAYSQPIATLEPLDVVASTNRFNAQGNNVFASMVSDPYRSVEQIYYDQNKTTLNEGWVIGHFLTIDGTVEMKIARPLDWFLEIGISAIGDTALIKFPEMGIHNRFKLLKVDRLTIKQQHLLSLSGDFQPITATVRRKASVILGMVVGGDTIGVTPEHRIFSHYRQDWVEARNLIIGEALSTRSGVENLQALDTLYKEATEVYNLEVRKNHNFYVGKAGVLVHNFYSRAHIDKIRKANPYNPSTRQTVYKPDTDEINEFATAVANMPNSRLNQFYSELRIPKTGRADDIALIRAWEEVLDAPLVVRENTNFLSKIEDLHSLGFVSSELKRFGGIGKKIALKYGDDAFALKVCNNVSTAMKNAKNKGYDKFGVDINIGSSFDELLSSSYFKNSKSDIDHLTSQLRATSNGNPGFIEQINEGLARLKSTPPRDIYIESSIKEGDIVDGFLQEAVQLKALTSKVSGKVSERLTQATRQFTTEVPPPGFKKIAEVRVLNSVNPVHGYSLTALRDYLQVGVNNLNASDLLNYMSIDKIRIRTSLGVKDFKVDASGVVVDI